jgi:hypothetical protein
MADKSNSLNGTMKKNRKMSMQRRMAGDTKSIEPISMMALKRVTSQLSSI